MGLDIEALKRARYVEPQPADPDHADEFYDLYHHAYVNSDFPDRADRMPSGFYEAEEEVCFRAGSYSGYNHWREWLAEFVFGVEPVVIWGHPDAFAGTPFYELIHFADNEGLIGPVTSRKLAADFARYDERARTAANGDGYYYETYQRFRQAFEMAAEDGLVQFC